MEKRPVRKIPAPAPLRFTSPNPLHELWSLLFHARDVVYTLRRRELAEYGLTAEQAVILMTVTNLTASGKKTTPAEISRVTFRRPHSVSEILKRMSKDGFLRKIKDLDRKNLVRVELTEKGRLAYINANKRESVEKVLARLSGQQREQLKAILNMIRQAAFDELGVKQVPAIL